MKSICVISFSDLGTDPRVNRQIRLLAQRYRVTAAGFAAPGIPGVEFISIVRVPRSIFGKGRAAWMLKSKQYEQYYWSSPTVSNAMQVLRESSFDLILANDLVTLPLALKLSKGRPVVLDAHEYAPREYEDRLFWRYLLSEYTDYLCRTYLHRVDGMLTVCQSIANEYEKNYGIQPQVLVNAPPYHELSPSPTDSNRIRMIHHGAVIPSRRIELMIEAMDFTSERIELELMLMPNGSRYFRRLEMLASGRPRVRIVPPVPMTDLPRRLNDYDLGVFLLPPTNLNYEYALPNKLFEFIQARLAIAIGPSPEMAHVVRQYGCGVIAEDFTPQSLASKLNLLTREDIVRLKRASHTAAKELCFEKNAPILLGIIEQVLGSD